MEPEITKKPRRPKTKLRKVRQGLKITVKCEGANHIMYLTPKGHLVLAHHSDSDLNSDLVLNEMADQTSESRCVRILRAWRTGENLHEDTPMSLYSTNIRPTTLVEKFVRKAARQYMARNKHLNKDLKSLPWPTSLTEAMDYLRTEFKRYGFSLVQNTEALDGQIRNVDIFANNNHTNPVKSSRFDLRFYNGKMDIQSYTIDGLHVSRTVTKLNLVNLIQLFAYSSYSIDLRTQIEANKYRVDQSRAMVNIRRTIEMCLPGSLLGTSLEYVIQKAVNIGNVEVSPSIKGMWSEDTLLHVVQRDGAVKIPIYLRNDLTEFSLVYILKQLKEFADKINNYVEQKPKSSGTNES